MGRKPIAPLCGMQPSEGKLRIEHLGKDDHVGYRREHNHTVTVIQKCAGRQQGYINVTTAPDGRLN